MTATATDVRIALCGLGGQGIVFLSRIVAGAALIEGRNVLAAETHGMSQRGGAVEAHVKIGSFESSLVRRGTADLVLALDESRVDAGLALRAPDGVCVASAREPRPEVEILDALAVARALEYPRGANLVVLGFAAARAPERLPSRDALLASLERLSPEHVRASNRRAFERGIELAT
jgi:indolepyruvate ferredoxin oxidoreductase beta subunit